ncbi:MAG: hypothetical protein V4495_21425 [Pseudomonadota bacterium]
MDENKELGSPESMDNKTEQTKVAELADKKAQTETIELDNKIKHAQIEKTRAETAKVINEAQAILRDSKNAFWSENIKILGAVVVGIGGVIVGYHQYEVAELKEKIAASELSQAEKERDTVKKDLAEALTARKTAKVEMEEAIKKRDSAVNERVDAEKAIAELKANLTDLTARAKEEKPSLIKSALTYVQFQGDIQRNTINELRSDLKAHGFEATGAQRVGGNYSNEIRYFSESDLQNAQKLVSITEKFFENINCAEKFKLTKTQSQQKTPPPLEIWISARCKG